MRAFAKILICLPIVAWGCSDDEAETTTTSTTGAGTGGGGGGSGGAAAAPVEMEAACKDAVESINADPGALPDGKGEIIRCAHDSDITTADLQAKADANGYSGKPFTSGAKVYRVLYRTERGTEPPAPGYSSALVYLPDHRRAESLPVVVASHGSRGQAGVCAPSLQSSEGEYVRGDFESQVFPLVGSGFAVIAPDLAGYSNYGAANNPPSGYALAEDVAKSTLDGARALRKLIPGSVSDQVVIVGHSQGGHTALSAVALAESYGADGTVAAAAVYAPLWLSQRTWGALFFLSASYPIAESPGPVAVSVWYHYTHGEILDGPGHGLDPFAADKREGIKKFIDEDCWSGKYPDLEALGDEVVDLFDPEFQDAVTLPAALGGDCPAEEPGKSICEKWIARYVADRPHLEGKAASVPIMVAYGGKDTTIPPNRFVCGTDRLTEDAAQFDVCFEPEADHGSILSMRADYVSDWIASKTLGEKAPDACPNGLDDIVSDGKPVKCATPPPND